jgi:hypothetical protein
MHPRPPTEAATVTEAGEVGRRQTLLLAPDGTPNGDMDRDLPPGTRLIFLIGSPRSGTTWLQLLLSASPFIASSVETHLFSLYTRSLFSAWDAFSSRQDSVGLHRIITAPEYFQLVRRFNSGVMAEIISGKSGATIILEKTPDHALYWQDILKIYPAASFIHLIRDPRAVTASLRAASRSWAATWEARTVSGICAHWIANVTAARRIRDATDNYLEVFYQDLKQDTVQTLQAVFDWCGVDAREAEVAEIVRQHDIERLRAGDGSGLALAYHGRGDGFFRRGEIDSWRSELTRRQVALVEHLTGELMDELGYAREIAAGHGRRSVRAAVAAVVASVCAGLAWRVEKIADLLSRAG